jgi:hypothetical protein
MSKTIESPFLRDYSGDIEELIADMTRVVGEVAGFIKERYGGKYVVRNLAGFLWVFTAIFLIENDVDFEDYCSGLKATYKYLKLMSLEEG